MRRTVEDAFEAGAVGQRGGAVRLFLGDDGRIDADVVEHLLHGREVLVELFSIVCDEQDPPHARPGLHREEVHVRAARVGRVDDRGGPPLLESRRRPARADIAPRDDLHLTGHLLPGHLVHDVDLALHVRQEEQPAVLPAGTPGG